MQGRLSELKCKEVINICDGARLGCVQDAAFDFVTGHITALIVPGPCRCLGFAPPKTDFVIPWCCVKRIGPDIILVDVSPENICVPRESKGWF